MLKKIWFAADFVFRQRCPQFFPEVVVADAADHVRLGPEACAGQRLIGPLSAPGHTERAPQEGLPQVRLARRPDD